MINRTFYIRVREDGSKIPMMEFFPPKFNMLAHLANGEYSSSQNVKQLLLQIRKSISEHMGFSFAADDWCIEDIKADMAYVSNGFDEFEPFQIETDFFIGFLKTGFNF